MTHEQIVATAHHEAGHHVAAAYFHCPSFPEVTPDEPQAPGSAFVQAGVTEMDFSVSKFGQCVVGLGGIMAQCLAGYAPSWAPQFKPTRVNLRDWFMMVMTRLRNLSDTDQVMIRGYKNPWRACRSAFRIVTRDKRRLRRLANYQIAAVDKIQAAKDAAKWNGIPKPAAFPATAADFVQLVAGRDFDAFILFKARGSYFNGASSRDWVEMEKTARATRGQLFESDLQIQCDIWRKRFARFETAEEWLNAAREFRSTQNTPPWGSDRTCAELATGPGEASAFAGAAQTENRGSSPALVSFSSEVTR